MKIQSICIGAAERLEGMRAKTGILKHAVSGAVIVDENGIAGDAVVNRKHHGGPDQALLVEGSVTLGWWAEELGHPLEPGTFGENLIIDGLDDREVAVGDRFILQDVILEATSPRIPCSTLSLRMGDPGFVKRYFRAARPGIYVRVLKPGTITPGEPVTMERYSGPRVGMAEIMKTQGRKLSPEDMERYLAAPVHHKLREQLLR